MKCLHTESNPDAAREQSTVAKRPAKKTPPTRTAANPPRRFVVGVSGASGAWYAQRLLAILLEQGHEVHLVVSDYGKRLLFDESGIKTIDLESMCPGFYKSLSATQRADATRRLRLWQAFAAVASLALASSLLLQYPSTPAPLPPSSTTLSSTTQPTGHTPALPANNPDFASATSAPLLFVPSAASTRTLPAAPSSVLQRLLTIGIKP